MTYIIECIKCHYKWESENKPSGLLICDPPYCPKCGGYTIFYKKLKRKKKMKGEE